MHGVRPKSLHNRLPRGRR